MVWFRLWPPHPPRPRSDQASHRCHASISLLCACVFLSLFSSFPLFLILFLPPRSNMRTQYLRGLGSVFAEIKGSPPHPPAPFSPPLPFHSLKFGLISIGHDIPVPDAHPVVGRAAIFAGQQIWAAGTSAGGVGGEGGPLVRSEGRERFRRASCGDPGAEPWRLWCCVRWAVSDVPSGNDIGPLSPDRHLTAGNGSTCPSERCYSCCAFEVILSFLAPF